MEKVKTYVAERSKAFAAGIGAAVTTAVTMAVINQAEKAFGFDLSSDVEGYIVGAALAAVNGLGAAITTFWAPANKPMEPKS